MRDDCQNVNGNNRNYPEQVFPKQSFIAEYMAQVRRTLIFMLGWGALVTINSFIVTRSITIVTSFLLGFVSSALYYLFMCYRVKKSAAMPAFKAVSYMRYGWVIRLSFILSVLIIAVKTPGIKLGAAVIGLLSLQIVIVLDAVIVVIVGLILRYRNKWK